MLGNERAKKKPPGMETPAVAQASSVGASLGGGPAPAGVRRVARRLQLRKRCGSGVVRGGESAGGRAGARTPRTRALPTAARTRTPPTASTVPLGRARLRTTSASGCTAHPARCAPHDPILTTTMAATKNEYHFGECPPFSFALSHLITNVHSRSQTTVSAHSLYFYITGGRCFAASVAVACTGDAPAPAADTAESQRIIGGLRLDKAARRRGALRSRLACALLGGGRVFLVIVSEC
ncbi:unnamed protein product [Arctia plantaginis]|uniref:Uncharacterized protein n=1 Tax=Arctia plantaginis TaxID=874455 RepID=A0A8S0YL96_ARCPL|nr:unnamed protein product [Arctia plantaginis]